MEELLLLREELDRLLKQFTQLQEAHAQQQMLIEKQKAQIQDLEKMKKDLEVKWEKASLNKQLGQLSVSEKQALKQRLDRVLKMIATNKALLK